MSRTVHSLLHFKSSTVQPSDDLLKAWTHSSYRDFTIEKRIRLSYTVIAIYSTTFASGSWVAILVLYGEFHSLPTSRSAHVKGSRGVLSLKTAKSPQ